MALLDAAYILAAVRSLLAEYSSVKWTDDQINKWIQEAAMDISIKTLGYESIDTITTTADTLESDEPSGCIKVHGCVFVGLVLGCPTIGYGCPLTSIGGILVSCTGDGTGFTNLYDFDLAAGWTCAFNPVADKSITFEFDDTYSITAFQIGARTTNIDANVKSFSLEGSLNNSDWTTILDTEEATETGWSDFLLSSQEYKYFKTTCHTNWGDEAFVQIGEIQFRTCANVWPHRLNDPSMTHEVTAGSQGAGILCSDEDYNQYWQATASGAWWKVDFGSVDGVDNAVAVKKLQLFSGTACPTSRMPATFKLYGSNDDSDWTEVYSGTATEDDNLQTFSFANATVYRYYKLDDMTVFPGQTRVCLTTIWLFEGTV